MARACSALTAAALYFALGKGLEEQGFVVEVCHDGNEALAQIGAEPFDLIVLDIMLPGRDGLSILKVLRDRRNTVPVILVTARSEANERVEGLRCGADDYITKPFFMDELLARVQAVLRRTSGEQLSVLRAGDLSVNLITREVLRGSEALQLPPREFGLLEYLMRSPGRLFTRAQILEHVWGYGFDPGTNLVDVCLLRLLGFGLFAVSVLNRVARERIDRELRALADSQVRKPQPETHWRRFDESLRSVYGEQAARQFLVKVTRSDGSTLYATDAWPADFLMGPLLLSLRSAPVGVPRNPPHLGDPRSPGPSDDSPERPQPPRRMAVRGPVYATVRTPHGEWRAMTLANEEVVVTLAMNLSGLHAEIVGFQQALLVAAPLGLLLLVAGGWLIGQVALRPVNVIARTAESVTAKHLDARIPVAEADAEFRRLIVLINGMLERLERSFRQATRFSADAAHELKTPLAILQAYIERGLQRAPDGSAEQHECAEQLEEVQRLKVILRKLLLLSQADAGQLSLTVADVNLASLVRAALDDVQMMAPGCRVSLQAPPEITVPGDADLLGQTIENIVSNAVKFGESGRPIGLELTLRGERAVLAVSNKGNPIPVPEQARIFDRFYRADQSRSRKIEGTGLGLSLAREIARAHGGDLMLSRSDDAGTVFELVLPVKTA